MKKESKYDSFLSSIYFAGKESDHPYFLQNDNVAIGISVLPEDSQKAAICKAHPHQDEIIIVLNGNILIEMKINDKNIEKSLQIGEKYIIDKNVCHRISSINNEDAAFIFIKSNPAQLPRSIPCSI